MFTTDDSLMTWRGSSRAMLGEEREHDKIATNPGGLKLNRWRRIISAIYLKKIVKFIGMVQDYLASGLQSVVTATNEIDLQLEKRAQTLRSLFSTKEVLPENHEVSTRLEKGDRYTCPDVVS